MNIAPESESCCFAIVPDGEGSASAIFSCLEDAIEWGLARYGADSFRIRHQAVLVLPKPPSDARAS